MKFLRNGLALAVVPVSVWLGFFVLHMTAVTLVMAAVAAVAAILLATSGWMKNAFLVVFSAIFAIGAAEATLRVMGAGEDVSERWGQGRQQYVSPNINIPDRELGYVLAPNATGHAVSRRRGRLVYEVDYSVDATGARFTPPGRVGARAIVLMGDSFHFGEGLNDDQTLGKFLQQDSQGKYWALNLARRAYGPHQTLWQLERDQPGQAGARSFDWLLLSVIDDHIERANGRYWWTTGPHFEPDGNGSVKHAGFFQWHLRPEWQTRLHSGSRLYVAGRRLWQRAMFSHDAEVFAGILRRIRELAASKYGARVLVIYHPGSSFLNDTAGRRQTMHQLFTQAGVDFIDVNKAIPDIDDSYFIADDGHPNEKLNATLSKIVLRQIEATERAAGGAPPPLK